MQKITNLGEFVQHLYYVVTMQIRMIIIVVSQKVSVM